MCSWKAVLAAEGHAGRAPVPQRLGLEGGKRGHMAKSSLSNVGWKTRNSELGWCRWVSTSVGQLTTVSLWADSTGLVNASPPNRTAVL